MTEKAAHLTLAFVSLIVYGVLTALGHDAENVLLILAGQGVGAGANAIGRKS